MSSRKVLLVGWDAADWKVISPLIDAGRMPNLARLVEGGVMGDMATLRPCYSPMLWTSIATGKRASKHGVLGFSEVTPDGRSVRPVTALSRRTKAIWNILHQQGLRSIVVGWWPSHPAEPIRGAMVSDLFHKVPRNRAELPPLAPEAVHPPEFAQELAALRLHPAELRLNEILPFVPRAESVDQDRDRRLSTVARITCEALNINTAATWLMDRVEWDFAAVYFDAIDHYSHAFMRYRAPRQSWVNEHDFRIYKDVIDAAYQLHDRMLGALLARTAPDTTVLILSDHGFHPDHLRPAVIPREPAGPALEHRDFGIFAARGPGIRKDQLVHGVNLLHVAPTVLTLFGLPVGADMDGSPLLQAFETPPAVSTVPTWDDVPGDAARHPAEIQIDPLAARESLRQLVALGYVEPLPDNQEQAIAQTTRELRYNLAQSLADESRHHEAAVLLRALHQAEPDEFRFALHLAQSCLALGEAAELARIVEDLDVRRRQVAHDAAVEIRSLRRTVITRLRTEWTAAKAAYQAAVNAPTDPAAPPPTRPRRPRATREERLKLKQLARLARFNPGSVDLLTGQLHLLRNEHATALERFLKVEQAAGMRPGLHIQVGQAYLGLKRWPDAQRSFLRALELDPDNPHAQLGMARTFLGQRRVRLAAEAALAALGKLHHFPMAHFVLAQALTRLRRPRQAIVAARHALAINPNFPEAHALLSRIHRRLGETAEAETHLERAAETRTARRRKRRPLPPTVAAPDPAPRPPGSADAPDVSKPPPPIAQHTFPPEATHGQPVIVVTGLPRSGTSLVMQMLVAGGIPARTDGLRPPDANNPRGYLEFEPVKRLPKDAGWLQESRGQAVKVVVPLLPFLPDTVPYRVILIDRHPEEIVASQEAMLGRAGFGKSEAPLSPEAWRRELRRQNHRARDWLAHRPHIPVLELQHRQVVHNPQAAAAALNRFFGGGLNEPAMAAVVDASLHRQRSSPPTG